ncbi:MAG TPA: site-specific DNA-methyltransferase [Methanosarcinaceae archaeon]|nr:site-specific DNA-methyltransferase [Methanosarcinaceae archaeon]
MYYNEDCIVGAKLHLKDKSVDLIITDPPFAIDGDKLHKHYNRNEANVIVGYVEIPKNEYKDFSINWTQQAHRVLKDDGAMYVVSGWSNLLDILLALEHNNFEIINHMIWKYNFGVNTTKKYVTSHYHILYCKKQNRKKTKFNTHCRFGPNEKNGNGGSALYSDLEDVWIINREYQSGKTKNKNQLPKELLKKIILYSSDENDLICDFFLGSFSTAKVAKSLNRNSIGFEINPIAFNYQINQLEKIEYGDMLINLKKPEENLYFNQGKSWSKDETNNLMNRYNDMKMKRITNKKAFEILSEEFGRGRFSILNIIKKHKDNHSKTKTSVQKTL